MGGFFGGLAAAAGGAQQPIQNYTARTLNQWTQRRQEILDHLKQTQAGLRDPGLAAKYQDAIETGLSMDPAEDPTKWAKKVAPLIDLHPISKQIFSGVPGELGDNHPTALPRTKPVLAKALGISNDGTPFGDNQPSQLPPVGTPTAPPASQPWQSPATINPVMPVLPPGVATAGLASLAGQGQGQGPQAQPQPQSAAQPATSPVQPTGKPIQIPPAQAAPAQAPPLSPNFIPGMPQPRDPNAILSSVMDKYGPYMTDAMKAEAHPMLQQELAHNEALRQQQEQLQSQFALHQYGLQKLKESGALDNLPPMMQGQLQAAAYGLPLQMAGYGAMATPIKENGISSTAFEATHPGILKKFGFDAQHPPPPEINVERNKMTGEITAVEGRAIADRFMAGAGGSTRAVNPFDPTSSSVVPGVVSSATAPRTSVSQVPGSAPTITTRSVGGPGGPGGRSSGGSGGGGTSIPPVGAGGGTSHLSAAQQQYEDDVMGGRSALKDIPAKERNAVAADMQNKKLITPTAMSPAGQKILSSVDPVIGEVQDLIAKLHSRKLDENDSNHLELAKNYQLYKHGFDSPYNDLFTNVSFERLRSGSQALQGMPSRAQSIIQTALEHAPVLDRMSGLNPDSTKVMAGKLKEMLKILKQQRNGVLADERKGGVVDDSLNPSGIPTPGSVTNGSGNGGAVGAGGAGKDPLGIR